MGLSKGFTHLLLAECKKQQFQGALMMLGRQDIYFSLEQFKRWSCEHGLTLNLPEKLTYRKNPHTGEDCIDDHFVFKALGFTTIESCDHSDYEKCDYVFDLNKEVPEELKGKYDVVLDGGTMEHVFHVPNVLRNMHEMLKPGGKAIHLVPTSNLVDHGFYMFCPTFFNDYYAANKYRIDTANLVEIARKRGEEEWKVYNYTPLGFKDMSVGGWSKNMLVSFFAVTRTEESTHDAIPQQGFYKDMWSKNATPAKRRPLRTKISDRLTRLPFCGWLAKAFALKPVPSAVYY